VTWVHLNWSEATAAQAMGVETNSTRQVAFCLERFDRAQRRHLAALRGLATAQSLLPAVKAQSGLPGRRASYGAARGLQRGRGDRDRCRRGRSCPDEAACEPERLIVFAGTECIAAPSSKAPLSS
jgi:hypothetical protein